MEKQVIAYFSLHLFVMHFFNKQVHFYQTGLAGAGAIEAMSKREIPIKSTDKHQPEM